MDIGKIIKEYGNKRDEIAVLHSMEKLATYIKDTLSEEEYEKAAKEVYEELNGKHFDEQFAKEQVEKMYYTYQGQTYYAPYWDEHTVERLYNQYRRQIPSQYNKWDFYVTLNMIKSDNCPLLKKWFPNEDHSDKIVELTINWLNDSDNPYGDSKIWSYFNK